MKIYNCVILITLTRFSIRLAQEVAFHLSEILSASHAPLTDLSEHPREILVTKLVRCNSVNLRACLATPVHGPSNKAYKQID